jgi:hypothetical protein
MSASAEVSATAVTDSPVAAADWNSFRQRIGPPEASLGQKATRVAEIVTRVTEALEQPMAISAKLEQHHLQKAQYFTHH